MMCFHYCETDVLSITLLCWCNDTVFVKVEMYLVCNRNNVDVFQTNCSQSLCGFIFAFGYRSIAHELSSAIKAIVP